jgi:hypothetical protein
VSPSRSDHSGDNKHTGILRKVVRPLAFETKYQLPPTERGATSSDRVGC